MEHISEDPLRKVLLSMTLRDIARLSVTSLDINTKVAAAINVYRQEGKSWWLAKIDRDFPDEIDDDSTSPSDLDVLLMRTPVKTTKQLKQEMLVYASLQPNEAYAMLSSSLQLNEACAVLANSLQPNEANAMLVDELIDSRMRIRFIDVVRMALEYNMTRVISYVESSANVAFNMSTSLGYQVVMMNFQATILQHEDIIFLLKNGLFGVVLRGMRTGGGLPMQRFTRDDLPLLNAMLQSNRVSPSDLAILMSDICRSNNILTLLPLVSAIVQHPKADIPSLFVIVSNDSTTEVSKYMIDNLPDPRSIHLNFLLLLVVSRGTNLELASYLLNAGVDPNDTVDDTTRTHTYNSFTSLEINKAIGRETKILRPMSAAISSKNAEMVMLLSSSPKFEQVYIDAALIRGLGRSKRATQVRNVLADLIKQGKIIKK